jgi:hypothetical protein
LDGLFAPPFGKELFSDIAHEIMIADDATKKVLPAYGTAIAGKAKRICQSTCALANSEQKCWKNADSRI